MRPLLLSFVVTAPLCLAAAASSPLDRRLVQLSQEQDVGQLMAVQAPVAVRRMSDDPSEKFYPEYWQFDDLSAPLQEFPIPSLHTLPISAQEVDGNSSIPIRPSPPFLQHNSLADSTDWAGRSTFWPRSLLEKRGYQCPTDTSSCASIGSPNVCCSKNEKCIKITDTGLGSVGCCPEGQDCSGEVDSCDTAQGYTGCPASSGGGCCIPGYQCNSIGCIAGSTSTTTTTAPPTTVVEGSSTSTSTSSSPASQSPSVTTTTILDTVTPSSGASTVYTTITTPTGTTTIGLVSAESVSTATATLFTTLNGISPPVRPTSSSAASGSYCPTGFYPCSAVFLGGCCQVGRMCDTSSCPGLTTDLVASDNVVTVVVETGFGEVTVSAMQAPTTGATTTTTDTTSITPSTTTGTVTITPAPSQLTGAGSCAIGWYSCAASVGGGCCPTGYGCGSYCSATVKGKPGKVDKVPPQANAAHSYRMEGLAKWMTVFAAVSFAGMVLL